MTKRQDSLLVVSAFLVKLYEPQMKRRRSINMSLSWSLRLNTLNRTSPP